MADGHDEHASARIIALCVVGAPCEGFDVQSAGVAAVGLSHCCAAADGSGPRGRNAYPDCPCSRRESAWAAQWEHCDGDCWQPVEARRTRGTLVIVFRWKACQDWIGRVSAPWLTAENSMISQARRSGVPKTPRFIGFRAIWKPV